jgi:tRNA (guanosine-2'-O-)-methyltransferase
MMITNDRIMNLDEKIRLRDYLAGFITERRFELFNTIVRNRTRYISLVLEDIFQPHNASAVLRSCDCFGVQDIHIIENNNLYEVNPDVALGSAQWLTLHRYNSTSNNTLNCLSELKNSGYRIVATTPHHGAIPLEDFDVSAGKFALVFGTEKEGLTEQALSFADEKVKLPMHGFTESFNISVSAALFLFYFTAAVRKLELDWQMTNEDMVDVQLDWLRSAIKQSSLIEKQFLLKNN